MIGCITKSTQTYTATQPTSRWNLPIHRQTDFTIVRHCELRVWVWRRGIPISQEFTLAANRSEQRDSPVEDTSGERFTNISVLESPPRHGCVGKGQKGSVKTIHLKKPMDWNKSASY